MVSATPVFEDGSRTSAYGSKEFSLELWDRVRNRGIAPTFAGPLSDDPELRLEFLVGARDFGFELVDLDDEAEVARLRAMSPPRFPLQPQQLLIADALNAAVDEAAIEIVRRGSKTTSIMIWCHGRCKCRPGYQVTFSAQSGVKGSARLREWKTRLDAVTPPDDQDLPPWLRNRGPRQTRQQTRAATLFDIELPRDEPTRRGFKIMLGEVGKGIYYENGSTFLVLKPDAEAYRGEAGDVSWIDEMQELDPEAGADLMAGLVPLQDTKEGGLIVCSGTAGEARVGPFWERVERLRRGDGIGGLDFCAPEDTPWELVEDEERAMELLQTVHPGIGTLTTLEKMRKNWHKLDKPKWAREYLSLWPETFGVRAVPAEQWADAAMSRRVPIPQRVAFGMAIKPGGGVAAIVAAWRNAKGVAYIEVVEHRSGTAWMPERAAELTTKYRGSTIAYDDIAEGKATATEMLTLPRRPRLRMQTYRETAAGCVQILRDLERGKLRHFDQTGLNAAAARAAKRETRNDQGVWLWTPAERGEDITCLDAATRALRNWDQHFGTRRASTGVVIAA
ncbi:hypothetical protein [Agromyces larvae]|uniref:Terminase n=1 Tax=Agromyces larvae TaxID=2929802 RepID=A0ABY4C1A7_9MICO|nr:hypothetical protein [Agromyces larvae]UOE43738.1 hypothetical protein MTO99_16440 [Agromyces larvae]